MTIRRLAGLLAFALLIAGGLAAFGIYSYANAFTNWPWTQTTIIKSGTLHGITIGSTKLDVQHAVATGIAAGRFSSIEPLSATGLRVPETDAWFVGLATCNCWLELTFADGRLQSIRSRRYYGPSE